MMWSGLSMYCMKRSTWCTDRFDQFDAFGSLTVKHFSENTLLFFEYEVLRVVFAELVFRLEKNKMENKYKTVHHVAICEAFAFTHLILMLII